MNYKKVIKDYQSGKLKRGYVRLMIDNDDGYWSIDEDDEERSEQVSEQLQKRYGGRPGGYSDIVDILQAAGVDAGWV